MEISSTTSFTQIYLLEYHVQVGISINPVKETYTITGLPTFHSLGLPNTLILYGATYAIVSTSSKVYEIYLPAQYSPNGEILILVDEFIKSYTNMLFTSILIPSGQFIRFAILAPPPNIRIGNVTETVFIVQESLLQITLTGAPKLLNYGINTLAYNNKAFVADKNYVGLIKVTNTEDGKSIPAYVPLIVTNNSVTIINYLTGTTILLPQITYLEITTKPLIEP